MKLQKSLYRGQPPSTRQVFDRDRLLAVSWRPGRIIVDVTCSVGVEDIGEVRVTLDGIPCQAWLEKSQDWEGRGLISIHLLVISNAREHVITIEPEEYTGIELTVRG